MAAWIPFQTGSITECHSQSKIGASTVSRTVFQISKTTMTAVTAIATAVLIPSQIGSNTECHSQLSAAEIPSQMAWKAGTSVPVNQSATAEAADLIPSHAP